MFPGGLSWAKEVLSFEDCVRLLRQNNAELLSAEENYKSLQSQVRSYYSSYLPQISANLGYQKGETTATDTEGYTASLSATQNIFNGFADSAKISEAEGKLKVAEANLKAVKAKLSYDLKSAFVGTLYAQDSIKLSKSILQRRTENLNMVELRFQSGRENKGSLLLSRANLKQAQLDSLKAEHALDNSRSALIRVLGLNPEDQMEVSGSFPQSLPPKELPSFVDLVEKTPEKLQAQGQIQTAAGVLQESTSGFLPTLNVSGAVGKRGVGFFPEEDTWNVGASLSWSLFSGGRDYFSRKSAFSQKLVAENNWRNSRLDMIAQLKLSYLGFVEAVEELKVSDSFVEAGTVRAEIGRSKYNNGLLTFDDWDRIENDLITYQKNQILKKRDRAVAEAGWEKTQGTGVLE
ncbi:TolC family protein [Bdellovibrio sp.]|uniref:TolC family protein n=1 Tax=Bdellovibrio sp. TaxID=28201 RepID=UPI0039E49AC7